MSTSKVLILLPGTTGSSLVDPLNPVSVWPNEVFLSEKEDKDDPSSTVFKAALADMESDKLRPGGVLLSTLDGATSYQGFVDYFTDGENFDNSSEVFTDYYPEYGPQKSGVASITGLKDAKGKEVSSLAQNALICFGYDWRQDNIKNGQSLQVLLKLIDGLVDGDYDTFLVGHSMGGLVSRAYLEVVGVNDSFYDNIQLLMTVGTPHHGAPLALSAISAQLPQLENAITITNFAEKLVDDASFPSSYQLLPSHLEAPFVELGSSFYSIYTSSPDGLNDILVNASYENADGITPDPASAANFDANTTLFDQLKASDLKEKYRCAYAINSGTTITGFTYQNADGSDSGIQANGTLSPVATASGGDLVVPTASAQFDGVVATDHTYQAAATDPNANTKQPWTENEPTHINLIGRTDVLAQIFSWMQGD